MDTLRCEQGNSQLKQKEKDDISIPKFEIETLRIIGLSRDRQSKQNSILTSATKAFADLNQITEHRKQQSRELKQKSIQVCLD